MPLAASGLAHPPPPANWVPKLTRGNVSFTSATAQPVFIGFAEWNVFATNLDILIDFSGADFSLSGADLFVRTYIQGASATGKRIIGSYQIFPGTGVTPHLLNDAVHSYCIQPGGIDSLQFLLHTGGFAAPSWGVEFASFALAIGPVVSNLIVSGIAHGRECGVPFPS
jgi:hypothetical protein